ncbi:hypothetical protein NOS3756_27590 [Nostoc sp. NIES-3756]|jgi:hypothetical protein|uniref:hypothetical protein n=1 Tax=Nostoc sp. NIES-3756 TaxID=1751286 RepID=UPI000720FE08|nr:hypothetical protein [Nostoc sp. NIES-3756]BAT53796.1 hypothetical protein NOS3756_27590 [Nostoc sp. NIES-3756]BAY38469.1 hypothetical protein NIES2111_28160 [Nostoc sp. NIES-2111]
MMAVPATLTYKGKPIHAHEIYGGYDIIVVRSPMKVEGKERYLFYIRNSRLEVVCDNSTKYGDKCSEKSLRTAREYIDILNII